MNTIESVETIKLKKTEFGTIRIGDTRVSLDSVVIRYTQGATAEEIVESFPDLKLSEIYGVISYYLANRAAVDKYISDSEAAGEKIRRRIEKITGKNMADFRKSAHARFAEMKGGANRLS